MAEALLKSSRLRVVFETGIDPGGKPIYKARNFANIRHDATAEELYGTALALETLSSNQVAGVERNDSFSIQ